MATGKMAPFAAWCLSPCVWSNMGLWGRMPSFFFVPSPILAVEGGTSYLGPVATFIGTLAALAIAIWKDSWQRMLFKPKIAVNVGSEVPFVQEYLCAESGRLWRMLRLQICNEGNEPAERLQVHLLDVTVYPGGGAEPTRVHGFVPVCLAWSHGGKAEKDLLVPQVSALVDIGQIVHQVSSGRTKFCAELSIPSDSDTTELGCPYVATMLRLCTEVEPGGSESKWMYPPGSYRLHLAVSSRRGLHWKGSVDVEFAHVKHKRTENGGWVLGDYAEKVTGNKPTLGVAGCRCGG